MRHYCGNSHTDTGQSEEGLLSESFRGIAAMLAEKTDISGLRTAHYTVSTPKEMDGSASTNYRIVARFNPQTQLFYVIRTEVGGAYRNSFHVNENGDVVTFCDNLPNKPFMEALLSEEGLPLDRQPFDLKFCNNSNPVEFATSLAKTTVNELAKYGILDPNLNPRDLKGPKSR